MINRRETFSRRTRTGVVFPWWNKTPSSLHTNHRAVLVDTDGHNVERQCSHCLCQGESLRSWYVMRRVRHGMLGWGIQNRIENPSASLGLRNRERETAVSMEARRKALRKGGAARVWKQKQQRQKNVSRFRACKTLRDEVTCGSEGKTLRGGERV